MRFLARRNAARRCYLQRGLRVANSTSADEAVCAGHAGSTLQQLDRCNVLVEDVQTGVLRLDSDSGGALPSSCLQALRRLFHKRLQPLLVAHAMSVLTRGPEAGADVVAAAPAVCALLTAVLRTATTPGSLGVRPVRSDDHLEI